MAGGGLMLSFSWLAGCRPKDEDMLTHLMNGLS